MKDADIKHNLVGLTVSALLITLILFILLKPATAVYLHPGTPSEILLSEGTTIKFSDVNLTIRGDEKVPINFLKFVIFNDSTEIAYVKFNIDGTELEESPSNKFNVTNTTSISNSWYGYGYMNGTDENTYQKYNFGYGYGYGYGGEEYIDIVFLYDIEYNTHIEGTFYAKLFLNSTTHEFISGPTINFTVFKSTQFIDPFPTNGSINITRPPTNLSVLINGSNMDVYFLFFNMTPIVDTWTEFINWTSVSTQRFEFTNFTDMGNDWIWGNVTYQWKVCMLNSSGWNNRTYHYLTDGSRYDVSNNGIVNVQDLSYTWGNRDGVQPYDGLYDVNNNSAINVQDLSYIWNNKT
jgi:hypothetical protein